MPIPSFSNFQSSHNLGADWAADTSDKEREAVGSVLPKAKATARWSINKSHVEQGSEADKHSQRLQDQVIQKSGIIDC